MLVRKIKAQNNIRNRVNDDYVCYRKLNPFKCFICPARDILVAIPVLGYIEKSRNFRNPGDQDFKMPKKSRKKNPANPKIPGIGNGIFKPSENPQKIPKKSRKSWGSGTGFLNLAKILIKSRKSRGLRFSFSGYPGDF